MEKTHKFVQIDGWEEAKQSGYTLPVPVLFLRDGRIGEGAKVLMAYMTRYANMKNGGICPSHRALAKELGVNTRTISRWMRELIGGGYVTVTKQGSRTGDTNHYALSWRPCTDHPGDDKK